MSIRLIDFSVAANFLDHHLYALHQLLVSDSGKRLVVGFVPSCKTERSIFVKTDV